MGSLPAWSRSSGTCPPEGRAAADRRLRERAAASGRGRHLVQCARGPRCVHRGARGRPDPGVVPAPAAGRPRTRSSRSGPRRTTRSTTRSPDRTVLILGYGSIGEALERRLSGFECDVIRVARRARDGVHPITELPELLPRADVVVLLTPATAETRGMVDAKFLAQLEGRRAAVNVARGVVVDTDALLAELGTRADQRRAGRDRSRAAARRASALGCSERADQSAPGWRLDGVRAAGGAAGARPAGALCQG